MSFKIAKYPLFVFIYYIHSRQKPTTLFHGLLTWSSIAKIPHFVRELRSFASRILVQTDEIYVGRKHFSTFRILTCKIYLYLFTVPYNKYQLLLYFINHFQQIYNLIKLLAINNKRNENL